MALNGLAFVSRSGHSLASVVRIHLTSAKGSSHLLRQSIAKSLNKNFRYGTFENNGRRTFLIFVFKKTGVLVSTL